jgi:predicted esterase
MRDDIQRGMRCVRMFLLAASLAALQAGCSSDDSVSVPLDRAQDSGTDARDGSPADGAADMKAESALGDGASDAPDASAEDSTALQDAPVADTLPLEAGPSSDRLTERPLGTDGAPNGFQEYLPPGYYDNVPRPLLVFWHGIGEDGNGTTDLHKLTANGIPQLIANDTWPSDRSFIVLMPQHGPDGCPTADEIDAFITWAIAHYDVDSKQIYLTGLSCGAIGSWEYLSSYKAKHVAAAVLIAGDPKDPSLSYSAWGKAGCDLGQVAIWALHGDQDPTVTITWEQQTMDKLLQCPAPPRRETKWNVIVGGGHAIWNPIYDLSDGYQIYDFLLSNPHP